MNRTRPTFDSILSEYFGDTLQNIYDKIDSLEKKIINEDRILTRNEAATKLNVQPNTISKYIKVGLIKNRGLGKRILVYKSEVDNLLNNKNQ